MLVKAHLHFRILYQKMAVTATVAALTMLSLGNATQIKAILFVSHHPRKPRQVQQLSLSTLFLEQDFTYVID
jgi:hypothetical protein